MRWQTIARGLASANSVMKPCACVPGLVGTARSRKLHHSSSGMPLEAIARMWSIGLRAA
jgi:hypothetical protein